MNRLKDSEAKTSTVGAHTFTQEQSELEKQTKGLTRSDMNTTNEQEKIQVNEEKLTFGSKEEENKAMMDRIKKDLDMYSKKYDLEQQEQKNPNLNKALAVDS